MNKRICPLLACLVWGLFLQGCSDSPDTANQGTGSGSVSFPEGPVELAIKWPVGNHYVQRMELNQVSSTRLPQRPDPMKQDVVMVQEYGISVLQERQPAGRELELEYLFASIDASMNNRTMFSFDSGGESLAGQENPMAVLFRNMVGMRLKLLLDEKNEVEEVQGLDEFIAEMAKTAPPRGRGIMTNMFSEETFKQMVEFGRGMPDRPVEPGDTWDSAEEIAMGPMGKVTLNLDYTFESWEAREGRACVRLAFTGSVESSGQGGVGPMGLKMQVDKGTMNGKSWFDPDLGMPVQSRIDQNLTLRMSATIPKIGDKGGGTQTFTTDLKQNILIKLVEFSGN